MIEEGDQSSSEIKPEGDEEEATLLKDDCELKFNYCRYCKGIIPKTFRKIGVHCSKVCSETNKVVPTECFNLDTGKLGSKANFTTEKEWGYYREVLRDKAASTTLFSQITLPVTGLELGMKVECLDINNPVNYCVATIIRIFCHRICLRYDGFGEDSTHDFWCNFQAEELFPIGWCAQNNYNLQPPTGISCTHSEWKAFLSRTLSGALAAPMDLFKKPENRRQLRCHNYLPGSKVEVIHPSRPDLIVPAIVTKSLGPYYYLVTTDALPNVPSKTFYGFADCPNVYSQGWCESRGLELSFPSAISHASEVKMIRKNDNVTDVGSKRSRVNVIFKTSNKVEALDGDDTARVATVAETFGRVALLVFDGLNKKKFIDKNSLEVFPIGWCESSKGCLYTPYGPVDFVGTCPTIGLDSKTSKKNTNMTSASFKLFQETNSHIIKPNPPAPPPPNFPIPQPPVIALSTPVKTSTVGDEKIPTPSSEPDKEMQDLDIEVTESWLSPNQHPNTPSADAKKGDLDQFVIWLLNKYELDLEDTCAVVKADLVDKFSAFTNRILSPRWFTSIYKLFPRVTSTRKCIGDRFVNCFKFLKETTAGIDAGPIYVKKAVEFLNLKTFSVQLGGDRLVAFLMSLGNYAGPTSSDDTQDIFNSGKAPEGSGIFVISADINSSDFTLNNFEFHFERRSCYPPLSKITNMNEFRAAMILCKQAGLCTGVECQVKTEPSKSINSKLICNARKFSSSCNIVAYPHKGSLCMHCKNIRVKTNSSSSSYQKLQKQQQQQQQQHQEEDGFDESMNDDLEETNLKEDEDGACELKIYFNKSCYPGLYLNPDKVSQIAPHTPQEKPSQALKYLIERLIEVSSNREQFMEIIEAGFGAKIFNKTKAKVVKKGLFRFNSRSKVLKFLGKLTQRLICCESFLSLEQTPCRYYCKGNEVYRRRKKENTAKHDEASNPVICSSSSTVVKLNPGQVINTAQGNVQVLYQLPPSLIVSSSSSATHKQHYAVQNSDNKNLNLRQRFPQGTQFFLPQTSGGGNVTYMVVSNKDQAVTDLQSSGVTNTAILSPKPASSQAIVCNPLSSPPAAGVSQILANVSKTNLVTDIDNPNVKNGSNTKTIWVKRENLQDSSYEQHTGEERKVPYQDNVKYSPIGEPSRSQYNPMRSVVQTNDKGHQIHVHKVQHGNARVKYVEFKPVNTPHNPHGYNQYYQNHQHLSVQTQSQPPKSPLHSPPALRPPPPIPPRSIALHSPPSLVPSPEVRPRFEYQNVRSPVQVTSLVHSKQSNMKAVNQSINLPRLPSISNQQNSPAANGKATVVQAFRATSDTKMYQSSNSGCVTTTVTMTYIPIQTSSSNKLVYVPVNSLQTNQGQPVVLYPHNQSLKDRNGKPVILSPQVLQGNKNVVVVPSRGENTGAFTTVRIQGNISTKANSSTSPTMSQSTAPVKPFKYQFGSGFSSESGASSPRDKNASISTHTPSSTTKLITMEGVTPDTPLSIKLEESDDNKNNGREIMNIINNSGEPASHSYTPRITPMINVVGNKRKLSIGHDNERKSILHENDTPDTFKHKKRRGRPPTSSKLQASSKNNRSIAPVQVASPVVLANRVLTDAFFKRQQQANQSNHFEEPLRKCPGLPEDPEQWTPDDVFRFLSATECSSYAAALKDEEMDGKSFLLLTRDALMEFKGFRLGPALKIVGYASYLRAKSRVLDINNKNTTSNKQPRRITSQKSDASGKTQTKTNDKTDTVDKIQTDKNSIEIIENPVELKEFVSENTGPDTISPCPRIKAFSPDKKEILDDKAFHEDKISDVKIEEKRRELEQTPVEMES